MGKKKSKGYNGTRFTEKQWDSAWQEHSFRIYKFLGISLLLPEYVPWDGRYIKLNSASLNIGKLRFKLKLPLFVENYITRNDRKMT